MILCIGCSEPITALRKTKKWCSDSCRFRRKDAIIRSCRWCSAEIKIPPNSPREVRGRKYCSEEHARLGAVKARNDSKKRMANGLPKRKGGRDRTLSDTERDERKREGIADRFFRKNPDRPRICQSCGETRVVEIAHKVPRRGAWQSLKNTKSADVWILCPTCHRCLDYGIQTSEELGLR